MRRDDRTLASADRLPRRRPLLGQVDAVIRQTRRDLRLRGVLVHRHLLDAHLLADEPGQDVDHLRQREHLRARQQDRLVHVREGLRVRRVLRNQLGGRLAQLLAFGPRNAGTGPVMRDLDLVDGVERVEEGRVDGERLVVQALADRGVGEVLALTSELFEIGLRREVGAHDQGDGLFRQVAGEGERGVEDVLDAAAEGGVDGASVCLKSSAFVITILYPR